VRRSGNEELSIGCPLSKLKNVLAANMAFQFSVMVRLILHISSPRERALLQSAAAVAPRGWRAADVRI